MRYIVNTNYAKKVLGNNYGNRDIDNNTKGFKTKQHFHTLCESESFHPCHSLLKIASSPLVKICAMPQLASSMPRRVAPCNTLCMQIHQMLSTVTAYDTNAISQVAFIT